MSGETCLGTGETVVTGDEAVLGDGHRTADDGGGRQGQDGEGNASGTHLEDGSKLSIAVRPEVKDGLRYSFARLRVVVRLEEEETSSL